MKATDVNSPAAGYSADELELLAYLLEEEEGEVLARETIPRRPPDAELRLSFAQERLWFMEQWEPATPDQHIPLAILLKGHLDVAALVRSLDEIMRRHEVLRTSFVAVDGRPVQVIAACQTVPMTVIDLGVWPEPAREAEVRRLSEAEARRLFDLVRGPLLRAVLIRLGNDEHLLLLTLHHIASDAWSIGVFIREVAVLYAAFAARKPAALPALPIQYADYALWQRAWLQGPLLESQLTYWKEQLAGASLVLELPADRPRPLAPTFNGAYQRLVLPRSLADALTSLGRRAAATLFMTLLAAFQTLLYRYSGQANILVGSPIANRMRQELEGLIGCFINTLVLRSDLSGAPSFHTLLRHVQQMTLDAYDHQDLPFELLVEALQPERDSSRQPLFQVMLVLQNAPTAPLDLPGLTLALLESPALMAKFDLLLMVAEDPAGLVGRLQYNTDLFDPATISRMAAHFQTLLEGLVADPDQPITHLPLLTGAERQQLLLDWNATAQPMPPVRGLHQLFEAQAARTPDTAAVVCGDQHLTYHALDTRANQLARYLRSLGVGPEVLVGLCLDRSLELLVALLGILKAGGAYVPLDPSYPPDRLTFMLEDSRAAILLRATTDDRPPTARQGDKQTRRRRIRNSKLKTQHSKLLLHPPSSFLHPRSAVVDLSADWPTIAQQPLPNLDLDVAPEQLAYVIYTSGSTGRPKGVQIPHRALVNCLCTLGQRPGLCAADTLLAVTTISFDIAALELFLPLTVGARVVLISQETAMDGVQLAACLRQTAATVMQATPATWRMLLAVGWDGQVGMKVLCGGEALPRELAAQLRERVGQLWNMYGPTETTIWSAVGALEGAAPMATIPLGQPIGNTQLYILDAQRQPVPVGVAGELYIGGAGLARGYRNRPDLTAEKFVPNPFADHRPPTTDQRRQGDKETRRQGEDEAATQNSTLNTQHSRLYRTGDLARYRADGTLEFLGRIDHQVKLRGYRIELGEIETVLAQHPDVRTAVVLAREDLPGEKRLVAYVVPKLEDRGLKIEDSQAEAPEILSSILYPLSSDLRVFLHERLPEYMLPAAFVLLEGLPLTPNGKVDRRALPAPGQARGEADRGFVAPRTAVEELLGGIWAEVLLVAQVGVYDNFFELGGHSLLATQVIARLPAAFQVELPLRALFEAPTVAALARRIESARGAPAELAPSLAPLLRVAELPLSFAQQRLWFLEQLQPGTPVYNIPFAVRLTGQVELAALQQSLQALIRRHEVLRTTFTTVEDQPVQVIAPALALPLLIEDLRGLPAAEQVTVAQQRAREEALYPFDLTQGPLLRVRLLQLDQTEHVVLFTMHHIIADGWSIGVLIRDLAALYAAYTSGVPAALPALPLQYADYALWQRAWLQGAALESQLAYWKEQLADVPLVLELPTDRPRPPQQTFAGAQHRFTLPLTLADALKTLSQRAAATPFMTLLAAFQTLLYRYSGQAEILVGSPIANRTRPELEGLIGCFVNTLVLRTNFAGNPPFRTLLQSVRTVALDAYAYQDLPFELLVDALQPVRDLSRQPLFQVMLVLQNAPMAPLELPRLRLEAVEDATTATAKFDLLLTLTDRTQGLVGTLEYSTDLFDPATVDRMVVHFQTLLEGIVADPDQPIATLPLLTAAERQQLLADASAATAAYPAACIHELFAAQVARTPDAVAVVYQDQQLTYTALDARTDQLAHYLRALGVGPEILVAISVNRSLDMLVGLLGILKAGGAYVPLDPTYPADRLAFMLQDSRAQVLLTATTDQRRPTNDQRPPTEDRGLKIEDSGADAPEMLSSILYPRSSSCAVVDLCADWPTIAQQPTSCPDQRVRPDNLAYVIYTSGSTGQPKGVLGRHSATVNRLAWMWAAYPFAADDICCYKTALSFVDSVWEIFGPLLRGVRSALIPDAHVIELPQLVADLERYRVTRLVLVPSLLRALVQTYPDLAERLPDLRLWVSSGEALAPQLATQFESTLPGRTLLDLYGASEVAADATWHELRWPHDPAAPVPIGRPIANTQLYILDRQLQLAPLGVAGELYIGGAGLARGYHNRPDLTAERFVPNPFADERRTTNDEPPTTDHRPPTATQNSTLNTQHSRLYRTGDLARYLPDGNLEFVGRVDHQVKVRGYRIELGEIEAVLAGHTAIRQAVVLVREDAPGENRLVAYIVPTTDDRRPTTDHRQGDQEIRGQADGQSETQHSTLNTQHFSEQSAIYNLQSAISESNGQLARELRAYLQEKLPTYMIPAAFVFLPALPLTPSGKIDRRALPPPDATRSALAGSFVAPRTPAEQQLADIWSQVLGLKQVGVHDNFFESGGDSLLSLRVVSRARQAGIHLNARHLFRYPTVAQLAAALATDLAIQPQAEQGPISGAVLLTLDQSWFLSQQQVDPQRRRYNISSFIEMAPGLDINLGAQALEEIVLHHDALRARFHFDGTDWYQVIGPPADPLPFVNIDLSHLPDAELSLAIEANAEQLQQSLNLTEGPAFRLAYFSCGPTRASRLLLILHHLVADGQSQLILLEDLHRAYQQLSRGEQVQLPPKTTSVKEWAAQLHEYANSAIVLQEVEYWRGQPWQLVPVLPLDYPEGENTIASHRSVRVALSQAETQQLVQRAQSCDASIYEVLLMAATETIAEWIASDWVELIDVDSGRNILPDADDLDVSATVGWLATSRVLVLRRCGANDPESALRGLLQQLQVMPNRGMGYKFLSFLSHDPEIVRQLRPLAKGQVLFNYMGQLRGGQRRSSELVLGPARERAGASENPADKDPAQLFCTSGIYAGRLIVDWMYSDQLHRRTTVEQLAHRFLEILGRFYSSSQ